MAIEAIGKHEWLGHAGVPASHAPMLVLGTWCSQLDDAPVLVEGCVLRCAGGGSGPKDRPGERPVADASPLGTSMRRAPNRVQCWRRGLSKHMSAERAESAPGAAPGCSRARGDTTIDAHHCVVTGPGEANGVAPDPDHGGCDRSRRSARRATHRVTHGEHSPLSAPPSCAASTTQHRAVVATTNFSAAGCRASRSSARYPHHYVAAHKTVGGPPHVQHRRRNTAQ